MARLVTSPDLFLVQSRLFSPGYAGIGRWVMFDPRTRRAFSMVGRDSVPDVIRIMQQASAGATQQELATLVPGVSNAQLDRVEEANLLVPAEECTEAAEPRTFVSRYQRATFDYPFHDHSARGSRAEEDALLDHYTRLWPPPPSLLSRTGDLYPLPRRELLDPPSGSPPGSLSAASLGWALEHSFGPTGEVRTGHATCIRRTSPSGGARHPAEVAVELPNGVEAVPAGTYVYDVARHGLVAISRPCAGAVAETAFLVRIRVDRAMWRYRDLRALRPVMLDVGHIVETLALLLARLGIQSTLTSAPLPPPDPDFAWLEEPPAARLVIKARQEGDARRNGHHRLATTDDELLTNPAATLHFSSGQIVGRTVWPKRSGATIDDRDFMIIDHCIPSTRGDRLTTTAGICEAIGGATSERVERLVDTGLLIPASVGRPLYRRAGLWVRHDWYLSMLAHLECLSSATASPVHSELAARADYVDGFEAVANRRTIRAFRDEPVSVDTVKATLDGALGDSCLATAVRWLRIFLAPLAVSGLSRSIYEWVRGHLEPRNGEVTKELVHHLTTGQPPAGRSACAIWLVAGLDVDDPARYELGLVELGRLGQRICLACTSAGLGVFLTPAVRDGETLSLLGIEDPATAAYFFGLGVPRKESHER